MGQDEIKNIQKGKNFVFGAGAAINLTSPASNENVMMDFSNEE